MAGLSRQDILFLQRKKRRSYEEIGRVMQAARNNRVIAKPAEKRENEDITGKMKKKSICWWR